MLSIMFVTVDAVGHVNACIGLGERLRDRGHKIIFAVPKTWKGKLVGYGFVEEILEDPESQKFKNLGEMAVNFFLSSGILSGASSLEKMKKLAQLDFFIEIVESTINMEPSLRAAIDRQKPDLFIVDHFVGSPSVIYSGKPWVYLFSGNPLYVIEHEKTPPRGSGQQWFYFSFF